jgi:2-desacetyl-2-hydroxyethyl bacteriochlorophyllide A dehydrogenase
VDYALPEPGPEDIMVRTRYSLMSIGTETTILHGRYDRDTHFARMFSFPQLQTGVQAIGVVEAAGAMVSDFAAGDLVYMRMGHGSHQVLPAAACSPVPGGLDEREACWAGLAKTAFRAAWAGGFREGARVLIIGAGPVGQMLTRWAAALGCAEIAVSDISPSRLEHARAGGATHLLAGSLEECGSQVAALGDGAGPPLVVDCTGNPAVFQPALAAAAHFGKVILLGDTGYPERQCLSSDLMTKGLTLQATHDSHDRDGWTERRVDERFFGEVLAGRFPLEGLITHEFNPSDCERAYQLAERERQQVMGILFDWTAAEYRDATDC